MARILIAEDDADIRGGLKDLLESEGHEVKAFAEGESATAAAISKPFDLVVLDVMMPGKSGYQVCREIREQNPFIPILMLTAKSQEIDKVVGLRGGADDYMTKPFGMYELLARIAALLRRSALRALPQDNEPETAHFSFGPFTVRVDQLRIQHQNRKIDISPRELKLLQLFAESPHAVLSRDFLLDQAWGAYYEGTTRTVDQHIAQLRKKIEADPADPKLIHTVHGAGYRFEPK